MLKRRIIIKNKKKHHHHGHGHNASKGRTRGRSTNGESPPFLSKDDSKDSADMEDTTVCEWKIILVKTMQIDVPVVKRAFVVDVL